MERTSLILFVLLTILLVSPTDTLAVSIEFELLTHGDNVGLLPQQTYIPGDYLIQTGSDDDQKSSYNPVGCFSFNFMNPDAEPDGYTVGIHSMTGSMALEIDLSAGGAVDIVSLDFDGYIAPSKSSSQWLNGVSNNGTYSASAASNWAFQTSFDWCYDTPFAGMGSTDMTFDNYQWSGFIIPVSELTIAGMDAVILDDPSGYFGGGSTDFESWLLCEVAPRLPQDVGYLLFAQGEAHPYWTNPMMGMTTDGIVGETIIAYAVPEPATICLLAIAICCAGTAKYPRSHKRNS